MIKMLMTVTTEQQYSTLMEEKNLPQAIDQLPGGGSVAWFGPKTAKRVVGVLAGGAFVLYASPQHMTMFHKQWEVLASHDKDAALAVLCYGMLLSPSGTAEQTSANTCSAIDTLPSAPYPGQFRQMCAFVSYLLDGRTPSDVGGFLLASRGVVANL
jgi:hypothetical protein